MNTTASPWIVDVTEETFEQAVLVPSQERPVVVDFWAPWCAPCRALGPILERLTAERKGRIILAKVNTEDAQQLAQYFQISAIPAVKIIYQSQIIHEFEGLQSEAELRQLFDQLAPDESALNEAQATEQASPEQAEQQYRELLAEQPENSQARLGLARALLAQNRLDEIEKVLEPVETGGEAGSEADRIKASVYFTRACQGLPDEMTLASRVKADPKDAAAHLELGTRIACRGAYEEALPELFTAAELDFKLAMGKAREVMVQVFYALGSNHQLANEYRGKLTRLLY